MGAGVDVSTWGDAASALALGIGLAACAGLRAWLPLLLAGGLARAGWLELGPTFGFLASNRALLLFAVATLIELAASVLGRVSDPLTALAIGLAVGAPVALLPHAAKSALRVFSSSLTGGLANPVISLIEDAGTVVLFVLAVLLPLLTAGLVLLLGILLLRRMRRRPVRLAANAR